jgi:hypothetical protein
MMRSNPNPMTTMPTTTTMDAPVDVVKLRVFDVLLRRLEVAKQEAEVAWARWKDDKSDTDALHRYVRWVRRCVRLKASAVEALAERVDAKQKGGWL